MIRRENLILSIGTGVRWTVAGPALFRRLFAAILTDNGTEFSDPGMIENYRLNPEHNSTQLVSRGVGVWFTDPYCSSQKPHIENFHIMLRHILQKGSSFNLLTQDGVNLTFSHLNRYPRADRTILRKNGVTDTKKPSSEK